MNISKARHKTSLLNFPPSFCERKIALKERPKKAMFSKCKIEQNALSSLSLACMQDRNDTDRDAAD